MKYMPAIFIHDELWNENYCALNVSKNDVLEILMSVLEEHCEKAFGISKFDNYNYQLAYENLSIFNNFAPVF